jgi:hypothetical protein
MDIRFTNRWAGFDRRELEKLVACLKYWRHSNNTIGDIMEFEIRCELAKRDVAEGRWE